MLSDFRVLTRPTDTLTNSISWEFQILGYTNNRTKTFLQFSKDRKGVPIITSRRVCPPNTVVWESKHKKTVVYYFLQKEVVHDVSTHQNEIKSMLERIKVINKIPHMITNIMCELNSFKQ